VPLLWAIPHPPRRWSLGGAVWRSVARAFADGPLQPGRLARPAAPLKARDPTKAICPLHAGPSGAAGEGSRMFLCCCSDPAREALLKGGGQGLSATGEKESMAHATALQAWIAITTFLI